MGKFWLFDWMDVAGVQSAQQARKAVRSAPEFTRAKEMAIAWKASPSATSHQYRVIAGSGSDLSGYLSCRHPDCRRKQAEQVFSRTWHFFDEVVVPDYITQTFLHQKDKDARRFLMEEAIFWCELRIAGVEEFIRFAPRVNGLCAHCGGYCRSLDEQSDSAMRLLERSDRMALELELEAEVGTIDGPHGQMFWELNHPMMAHTSWGRLDESSTYKSARQQASHEVSRRFSSALVSDLETAKSVEASLGLGLEVHRRLLGDDPIVAPPFDLQLPMLDDVPITSLLRLRREGDVDFRAFQLSLRKAFREVAHSDTDLSPAEHARRVEEGLILPELVKMEKSLRSARKTYLRNTATSVSIGTAAMVCGVVASMAPLLVAGASLAAGGTVTAAANYQSKLEGLENSDMYFLWKHGIHRH